MPRIPKPEIGDRIVFKACTRYSFNKATRVVNGYYNGRPTVRYAGYAEFVVDAGEIIKVIKKEAK